MQPTSRAFPIAFADTRSLAQHVSKIQRQVEKSMRDGETRQLAVKIVSDVARWEPDPRTGKQMPYLYAWGQRFKAPTGEVCAYRDERCEVEKVWAFVRQNVRYVYDPPKTEVFCTASVTLEAGGADCDDYTIVFASLLGLIGFPTVARVIATERNGDWVHIYPLVGLSKDRPKSWVPLDGTVASAYPGWEFPGVARHQDFQL